MLFKRIRTYSIQSGPETIHIAGVTDLPLYRLFIDNKIVKIDGEIFLSIDNVMTEMFFDIDHHGGKYIIENVNCDFSKPIVNAIMSSSDRNRCKKIVVNLRRKGYTIQDIRTI